jgi:hypothetical protein
MDMQPVKSSAINAVGYDPETHTMHVEFRDGAKYEYGPGIMPADHEALVGAPSIGRHFQRHVARVHEARRVL